MKYKFQNVDEYIQDFPEQTEQILQKIREIVKEISPEAIELISYQMPSFKLNGKNLVHFAGYAKHIGFYPLPAGIIAFEKELEIYKHAKGSAQFPLDKEIPYNLIRKIVQYRVAETLEK